MRLGKIVIISCLVLAAAGCPPDSTVKLPAGTTFPVIDRYMAPHLKPGVEGTGQLGTSEAGDVIMIDRSLYDNRMPVYGEVVAFVDTASEDRPVRFLRVMAAAGDTIEIVDGVIKVNGSWMEDPFEYAIENYYTAYSNEYFLEAALYLPENDVPAWVTETGRFASPDSSGPADDNGKWAHVQADVINMAPMKVPDNHVFLIGDNRGISIDSRLYGAVSMDRILGRAERVVNPSDRRRKINHKLEIIIQ